MADLGSYRESVIRHILAVSDAALDPSEVTPDTLLREDLNLASLQAVTLVMDLEEEFDITVEDEELENLLTVGDVFALIEAKRDAAA